LIWVKKAIEVKTNTPTNRLAAVGPILMSYPLLHVNRALLEGAAQVEVLHRTVPSLFIGDSGLTTPTEPSAATIDDVRIYNRALSATDIKQLYNAGR
jgi:hypothetical protein